MKETRIRFHGEEYLLIGDITDAPIAKEEDYRNGICGYAHVIDGKIWQHGEIIGSAGELEILGETEVKMSLPELKEGLVNVLTHPSWVRIRRSER